MGYFRVSGFIHLHKLIMDSGGYERFSSIRLLVGLNVDSLVFELERTNADISRLNEANKAKFTQAFSKAQQKSIQKESYQLQVEKSLQALQHALESNLLQIRIVRDKNAHAKFYLFYSQAQSHTDSSKPHFQGSLIVGSSNLSHNGLENNYEFNLLSKNSDDLAFSHFEFESLWESAIPLDSSDVERAKKGTYLEKILSPKEMYHKLLLCHFGEVFLHTDSSIQALIASANYTPYDYQIHAVQEGIDKLERYNGFFLSDVVGLGKTLIACVIAKKLQTDSKITGRILICAPNAVQKSWKKHKDDLKLHRVEITTHDSLHKLEDKESFELIIIDESHNFRNQDSNRYKELQALCKIPYTSPSAQTQSTRKKVILLSATPQNNSPKDLEQQIYLFRDKRDTAIVESQSLERFFKTINDDYDKLNRERKELNRKKNEALANAKKPTTTEAESKNTQALQKLSDTLREKLLAKIMIRRTRGDIQSSYANDKTKQGLHFPKITDPKPLEYDLDSISHNLATQTLLFLAGELNTIAEQFIGEKNGYTYARYLIYPNLTEQGKQKFRAAYGKGKDDRFYKDQSTQLAIFMQKILFKRFDSSIKAFKDTLDKQIHSYEQMLKQFQTDAIYLPKNYDNRERLYRLLEEDNDQALEELLEQDKLLALHPSDFHKDYAQKLQIDRANLQALLDKWEQITQDPKLDKLQEFLDSQDSTQKVVIFTEAKSSSEYLYTQLESTHLRGAILHIHSGNRNELESSIRANFDANYPENKQQNDKRVIITTDVLAEGVNLHRANIIINYDTPYNATRLMQRIGRINRIGTPHKQIHIYNFKPTHFNDHIIDINAIASQKIQSFHYTLGEDSAIYDESEEFDSKKLFKIVQEKEQETSKDTKYQNDLRDLYFNDKAEFARIKALPSKSRCFIQLDSSPSSPQSYAYLKRDAKSFAPYHIADTNTLLKEAAPKPCLFYDIADFLKAHITHKPYKPSGDEIALHFSHTQAALDDYAKPSSPNSPSSPKAAHALSPQERNALTKLRHTELESSLKDSFITALHNGTYHHLAKDINNAKSLQDFKNLAHKYGFTSPPQAQADEPQAEATLKSVEIELSITAFAKAKQ
ncbi:helicase-related protein [uncultured Helicobacter sp.]|uniref:helicase-related protein n=1 Tax=uncultured Helicobacter sp. TaxID=175537 RepID=UPI00262417E5|nr:helicase-related protein [uncultured Helicobacter sp.]